MKPRDLGLLFILAALWGASFLYIRIAVPVLGPFVLVAARTLIASGALLLFVFASGREVNLRKHWKQYLILGALNSAIPFVLIAAAEEVLTSSFAAILNATTPLFSAVVAAIWLRDRLTLPRIIGLLIGLCGVSVVVGLIKLPFLSGVDAGEGALFTPSGENLIAVAFSLGGALFYALGSSYARVALKDASTYALAIGQQLAAGLIVLPLAATHPPAAALTVEVAAVVLALALLSTSLAYLIYFTLLARVGPTNTLTVTFLVPFFGIFWGALLLNEHIGWEQFIGLLLILGSLTLVTGFRPGLLLRAAGTPVLRKQT
ncbi:MAG: DMT family transporter [Anaerolineae bacterium]|nr:DMT family transporter [Anaerolineae bacterium]